MTPRPRRRSRWRPSSPRRAPARRCGSASSTVSVSPSRSATRFNSSYPAISRCSNAYAKPGQLRRRVRLGREEQAPVERAQPHGGILQRGGLPAPRLEPLRDVPLVLARLLQVLRVDLLQLRIAADLLRLRQQLDRLGLDRVRVREVLVHLLGQVVGSKLSQRGVHRHVEVRRQALAHPLLVRPDPARHLRPSGRHRRAPRCGSAGRSRRTPCARTRRRVPRACRACPAGSARTGRTLRRSPCRAGPSAPRASCPARLSRSRIRCSWFSVSCSCSRKIPARRSSPAMSGCLSHLRQGLDLDRMHVGQIVGHLLVNGLRHEASSGCQAFAYPLWSGRNRAQVRLAATAAWPYEMPPSLGGRRSGHEHSQAGFRQRGGGALQQQSVLEHAARQHHRGGPAGPGDLGARGGGGVREGVVEAC